MLLISIVHHIYKTDHASFANVRLVIILRPTVVFWGFLMYKMFRALGIVARIRLILDKLPRRKRRIVEIEPDRLVNPAEYEPLYWNLTAAKVVVCMHWTVALISLEALQVVYLVDLVSTHPLPHAIKRQNTFWNSLTNLIHTVKHTVFIFFVVVSKPIFCKSVLYNFL